MLATFATVDVQTYSISEKTQYRAFLPVGEPREEKSRRKQRIAQKIISFDEKIIKFDDFCLTLAEKSKGRYLIAPKRDSGLCPTNQ